MLKKLHQTHRMAEAAHPAYIWSLLDVWFLHFVPLGKPYRREPTLTCHAPMLPTSTLFLNICVVFTFLQHPANAHLYRNTAATGVTPHMLTVRHRTDDTTYTPVGSNSIINSSIDPTTHGT